MKRLFISVAATAVIMLSAGAQQSRSYHEIDSLLVSGIYDKAIDSCRNILATDSLNARIWYKMGMAWKNMQPDESSFDCFLKASKCDPENSLYRFNVAKGYFNKNKIIKARPIFMELYKSDTLNWDYAFYLTSIFMQQGNFDDAIKIYQRFLREQPGNYVILDKLGFANLRKGEFRTAIDCYNKSLAVNGKNLDAIRNLSFLYPMVGNIDTALVLLDRGIKMDPEDIDLYARRGTIHYSIHYNKRALNDYLKILSLGDSSFLYLKRAGIGYFNNMQPKEALVYLNKATVKDTTDYETVDYIAQCYRRLNDRKKSAFYYNKVIGILEPLVEQEGITHLNLGQEYAADSLFLPAVENYQRCYELTKNHAVLMLIANVYDEGLGNTSKAIPYYRQFLNGLQLSKRQYTADYIKSIQERLDYLVKQQSEQKKAPARTAAKE